MDVEELYRGLDRLQENGEIGDAYSGCGEEIEGPDYYVLMDFLEYIEERYFEYTEERYKVKESTPLWAEAFVQIFNWQFDTIHEWAKAYYENFYGDSEYKTIIKVADYLRENGYHEIAEPYAAAAVDCKRNNYPEEMTHLLPDEWIYNNDEIIWNFYVDILTKHKQDLLS